MSGISSKAAGKLLNRFKFNSGNELQSGEFSDGSGLETYDAVHRMYDPQIGRFHQIDALADVSNNYSPYSFGSDNPILRNDPLGLADTITINDGNVAMVRGIRHKPPPAFSWPNSTKSDRQEWDRNERMYYSRSLNHKSLNQKGDPASYTSHLPMYKRWHVVDQNYRAMQAWAVGILGAPALLTTVSPAALATSIRIKSIPFLVDATVQTVVNGMQNKNVFSNYNFAGGVASLIINAPEGAAFKQIAGVSFANSLLSSSVTLSGNSINGSSPVFSFNPISIIINAVFGAAAGQYSEFVGTGSGISSFGDAAASPINLTGVVLDEAIKKKE